MFNFFLRSFSDIVKSRLFRMAFKHPTWHHGYNSENCVLTPHVTISLQCPPPKEKKIEHTTSRSFKKVSNDEVFTWKLIRHKNFYRIAIAF